MFVAIYRGIAKGQQALETVCHALYECNRVYVTPVEGHEDDMHITMELEHAGAISTTCDKRTTNMFVMNNEGKTIANHRWSLEYR